MRKSLIVPVMCRIITVFILLIFFAVYGCAKATPYSSPPQKAKSYKTKRPKPYKIGRKWYQPLSHARNFKQKGIASWYGADFHGKKTANGEVYDMYAVTAAHKTLPLGTYVRVHNLENGKKIDVRINDRGPFVRGRIIDLSYTVAKELGVVEKGTARVKIEALGSVDKTSKRNNETPKYVPKDYYSGIFTFQVGAFSERENAEKLRKELDKLYKNAHISTFDNGQNTFYRVRVGKYNSLEQIIKDEQILIDGGFEAVIVVAE